MLLTRLARFNQRHPWSHNDHYARWAADRVAESGARNVLDIGCGTGNLVALLRQRVSGVVVGLEPHLETAHVAVERFADEPSVSIDQIGFADRDLTQRWDAITAIAVLHHLPLTSTLGELRDCLTARGGRLVIVGCYREVNMADILVGLAAMLANPMIGLIKHPARADTLPAHMTAPTAAPHETLRDVRLAADKELPGARIKRRLFWRYTLVYDT